MRPAGELHEERIFERAKVLDLVHDDRRRTEGQAIQHGVRRGLPLREIPDEVEDHLLARSRGAQRVGPDRPEHPRGVARRLGQPGRAQALVGVGGQRNPVAEFIAGVGRQGAAEQEGVNFVEQRVGSDAP